MGSVDGPTTPPRQTEVAEWEFTDDKGYDTTATLYQTPAKQELCAALCPVGPRGA